MQQENRTQPARPATPVGHSTQGEGRVGDPDRSAVYAAEDALCRWLDVAQSSVENDPWNTDPDRHHLGATTLAVSDQTFHPEIEPRFTDPQAAGVYAEQVLTHLQEAGKDYHGWEARPVTVRPRKGGRRAEYFRHNTTIALPTFEVGGKWSLRGTVVLHELAHHLTGRGGLGPHFRATFLRLLEDIGAPETARMLHSAYTAEGLTDLDHATAESTLSKISKLLRQAEGTDNQAEKEAFLGKAQVLATRNSIALAVARAHAAKQEQREVPAVETYRIGPKGRRGLARYIQLLIAIAHANDLKCTIRNDSTAIDLYGFGTDIAVVKAMYESLLVQMVNGCEHYLADTPPETASHWNGRTWGWQFKPAAKITRRLSFYEAYAKRIRLRLQEAKKEAVVDSDAHDRSTTELALRDKAVAVHDLYAEALRKNDIRGTWKGGRRSSMAQAPEAAQSGWKAAERASLGQEKALGARR